MPRISPEDRTALEAHLRQFPDDTAVKQLLAQDVDPAALKARAGPVAVTQPAGADRPDQSRAANQQPVDGQSYMPLPGEKASVGAKTGGAGPFGMGASVGGAVGGALGGAAGALAGGIGAIPGRTIGSAVGGAVGNLAQQTSQMGAKDYDFSGDQGDASLIPKPGTGSFGDAAKAGLAQGAMTGGLGLLGKGAAAAGFPRVAALLGGTTPQAAQLGVTPQEVQSMATGSLNTLDATGAMAGPQAVKSVANGMRSIASDDLRAGLAAQAARSAAPKIQSQLAGGALAQAPRNAALADAVGGALSASGQPDQQAILKAIQGGAMQGANKLPGNFGGPPADVVRQAFLDPNSFPQTAGSSAVAAARIPVAQGAAQQQMLGDALGKSNQVLSDLTARGLQDTSVPHLATEVAGLRSLTRPSLPQMAVKMLPGKNAGTAIDQFIGGTGSGNSMMRQAAAVLGSRGLPSLNPQMAAQVSGNQAFTLGQPAAISLADFLASMRRGQQ